MTEFIENNLKELIWAFTTGGIGFFIKSLYQRVQKEISEQKLMKEGLLAILHDQLYQACTKHITQGYVTISALKNLEYLYISYHALGGNGTGTHLYETCCKLKKVPDSTNFLELEKE